MTKVFLIVYIVTTGHWTLYQHEIKDMSTCQEIIKSSTVDVGPGAENESSIVMYCSPTLADKLRYRLQQEKE